MSIARRIPFSAQNPYRTTRPATKKIIFLSLEGCVTEYEYFKHLGHLFANIKSHIQFIPVTEDETETADYLRTQDQRKILSSVRPYQLAKRIDCFKQTHNSIYLFDQNPEDEFWIVTDVDQNWSLWVEEWVKMKALCQEKGYNYALSNPFFEIWLLLHHDTPKIEDFQYAVGKDGEYRRTTHFKERLREVGAPLKDKHISEKDYTKENVLLASERAKKLHKDRDDLEPPYLASTVYLLIEKLCEIEAMNTVSVRAELPCTKKRNG